MKLFSRKKKKNKETRGRFERIEVDGKTLPIMNFYMFLNKNEGKRYMELAALEEIPEIHFSEIELDVILTEKKLHICAAYNDAFPKGKFKIYKFEILSVNEYFI